MAKKTLGEIIKETMKEKGIKSSSVARKMNVSRQAISQSDQRKKFDLEVLQRRKEASGLDFTAIAYENSAHSVTHTPNSAINSAGKQPIDLPAGTMIKLRVTATTKEKLYNI